MKLHEFLMNIGLKYRWYRFPTLWSRGRKRAGARAIGVNGRGTGMNKRDGATDSIRWHRLSCSDNGYVSGYISDDGDWIVGRSGRQATVWQYVPETEINNRDGSEPGGPWHKDLGLIDTVNGRWFVHMWDSVTIGDAKYEVGMLVNGTGIKEGN